MASYCDWMGISVDKMQAWPSIFTQVLYQLGNCMKHHYGTTVDLESLSSRTSLSSHQWIRFIFRTPQGLAPLNNYFFFFFTHVVLVQGNVSYWQEIRKKDIAGYWNYIVVCDIKLLNASGHFLWYWSCNCYQSISSFDKIR